jgi:p-aminobenzoyl-glutamate transporter AbgT
MTSKLWKKIMGDYAWVLILVGWFVLMKFVLPRFGVGT